MNPLLRATGLKLLIVEVVDPLRRQISERLRTERRKVFEAAGQSEAKEIIQRNNIDVVLLGLGGLQQERLAMLGWIKRARPFTEVILLTSSDDHSLYASMQAMKLGAFDDLLIPLDMGVLLARIEEAHKRKKERVLEKRSLIRMKREAASASLAAEKRGGGSRGGRARDAMPGKKEV